MAFPLAASKNGNLAVYDLRHDPSQFVNLSPEELRKKFYASWEERKADGFISLPVKELAYNRVPAVAPLGVLESGGGWDRLALDAATVEKHRDILLKAPHFAENMRWLYENRREFKKAAHPESQLYDGFVNDRDRLRIETVRNALEHELADFRPEFSDERLPELLLRYKARSFPGILSEDEARAWEQWRADYVKAQLPGFMKSLQRLSTTEQDEQKQFILQELQLWAESIMPIDG